MPKKLVNNERTLQLAERLLQDIQNRKLQPGDTYYTTIEAASFLGVAGASANHALQYLEKRKVIARSQKLGAVILGSAIQAPTIDHVHFLFNDDFNALGPFAEELVQGVHQEFPLAHISSTTLNNPRTRIDTVTELLQNAKRNGLTHGFIMVRSTPDVQKILAQSGAPSVLLGTKCPGIPTLNQLDLDRENALRLLLEYLHQQYYRRIAIAVHHTILPEETTMINTAMRLGIPHAFFLQHNENDPVLLDEISELITRQFDPEAVICLNANMAIAFAQALEKINHPGKVELTALSYPRQDPVPVVTHIAPQSTVPMTGRRLAQRLLDTTLGLPPRMELLPVTLVYRDRNARALKDCPRMPQSDW